jgi:hypothetical protein
MKLRLNVYLAHHLVEFGKSKLILVINILKSAALSLTALDQWTGNRLAYDIL